MLWSALQSTQLSHLDTEVATGVMKPVREVSASSETEEKTTAEETKECDSKQVEDAEG